MNPTSQDIPEERAREIIELAESIANEHCPSGRVNPETIIPEEIELVYDYYGDEFDGKLEYEDGNFSIHCNLDWGNLPGSARARYTISHELGHYFIPSHREAVIRGQVILYPSFADKQESMREREANLFASHLLMPGTRFKAAIPRARKGLGGIIDLADKFKASLTCVAIRYVDDEVEPSVAVKWLPNGFEWKRMSGQFRTRNYAGIVTNLRALPKSSPTRMCVSAGQTQSGVIDGKTSAATWFRNTPPPREMTLLEEAMTLGRFGSLTLLTLPEGRFPQ